MGTRLVAAAVLMTAALSALADDAEDRALKAVAKLGGRYERADKNPAKAVVLVSLGNTKVTDEELKDLAAR